MKNEVTTMSAIARRVAEYVADSFELELKVVDLVLDLQAVHSKTPLNLQGMFDGDLSHVLHDVLGIRRHVIREGTLKGYLRGGFVPRYALDQ
tara:strand:- start:1661 stop:1936 length:276 start_codon:yes stop_codon:yes gene_type:complete